MDVDSHDQAHNLMAADVLAVHYLGAGLGFCCCCFVLFFVVVVVVFVGGGGEGRNNPPGSQGVQRSSWLYLHAQYALHPIS